MIIYNHHPIIYVCRWKDCQWRAPRCKVTLLMLFYKELKWHWENRQRTACTYTFRSTVLPTSHGFLHIFFNACFRRGHGMAIFLLVSAFYSRFSVSFLINLDHPNIWFTVNSGLLLLLFRKMFHQ